MPGDFDTVKEHVDIVQLISERVRLKKTGRAYTGLCPFHSEKTPSFQVDVEKQFYYCFGCQEGGDLFRFVQKIQNVDFPEALEILARRAGVKLEMDSKAYGKGSERGRLVKLYDALHEAKNFYHRLLLEGDEAACAREYLKRRGIAPVLWEKFELGYSPGEWDRLLKHALRKDIEPEALELVAIAVQLVHAAHAFRKHRHALAVVEHLRAVVRRADHRAAARGGSASMSSAVCSIMPSNGS